MGKQSKGNGTGFRSSVPANTVRFVKGNNCGPWTVSDMEKPLEDSPILVWRPGTRGHVSCPTLRHTSSLTNLPVASKKELIYFQHRRSGTSHLGPSGVSINGRLARRSGRSRPHRNRGRTTPVRDHRPIKGPTCLVLRCSRRTNRPGATLNPVIRRPPLPSPDTCGSIVHKRLGSIPIHPYTNEKQHLAVHF